MRARTILCLSLGLTVAAGGRGARPDFTGTWKLRPELTSGPVAPGLMTLTVTQTDSTLSAIRAAKSDAGDVTDTLAVRLDGAARVDTTGPTPAPIRTTSASWNADTLAITTRTEVDGSALNVVERWSVEPGGTRLHIQAHVGANGQDVSISMVLDRDGSSNHGP